jgi:hypothetical protein
VTDSKHAFAGEVVLEQGKYTWEFLEDHNQEGEIWFGGEDLPRKGVLDFSCCFGHCSPLAAVQQLQQILHLCFCAQQ